MTKRVIVQTLKKKKKKVKEKKKKKNLYDEQIFVLVDLMIRTGEEGAKDLRIINQYLLLLI